MPYGDVLYEKVMEKSRSSLQYWFIRLRYAYLLPQFYRKYDGYGGNIHTLTLGIGCFQRRIKRIY
jgi:hypothetical protein